MYLPIKLAAMAANLFVPPSYDQVEQFITKHMQPPVAAEAPLVAAEDPFAGEAAIEDFTFLPPWEAESIADPPLPVEDDVPMPPAIADTAPLAEEEVIADNSGPVSPLPAYWVDGTDEPDTDEVAVDETHSDYVDGTDDDAAYDYDEYAYDGDGYEESYEESYDDDDESYMAEYTEEYYRELEERFAEEQGEDVPAEEVAAAPVDDSIDGDWYEEAEAHDPFGPVADAFEAEESTEDVNEYHSYDELGVEESTAEEAVEAIESSTADEDTYSEEDYSDEYNEDYYSDEYNEDYYNDTYYAEEHEAYSDAVEEAADAVSDIEPTEAVEEEYSDEDYADEYYADEYYDEEYDGSEYDDYDYEAYEEPAVEAQPEEPITAATPEVAEVVESSSDPALQRVISNWDSLSFETRDTILSLVEQESLQAIDSDIDND